MGVFTESARKAQADFMRRAAENPEIHPRWKGDNVGYRGLHSRIVKLFGKADHCENQDCTHKDYHRFEWANLTNEVSNERDNWAMLCVFCHRQMDKQGIAPRLG